MNNSPCRQDVNIRAEINKLIAQTSKIAAAPRWHAYVEVALIFGAAAALIKLMEI